MGVGMGVSSVPRSLDQALPEIHTAVSRISEKHLLVQAEAGPGSGRAQDRSPGPLAGPATRGCLPPPPLSFPFCPLAFLCPAQGQKAISHPFLGLSVPIRAVESLTL